jgi:hypothetical protein
LRSRAS